MSPLLLISPGMIASLGVSLVLRFVWAAFAKRQYPDVWRTASAGSELVYVCTHAVLGAGIGALFWLSWGLSALVEVTWWQRGLVFGLLNATVFCALPMVIVHSLVLGAPPLLRLVLVETFCSCVAASLACSWAWSRPM